MKFLESLKQRFFNKNSSKSQGHKAMTLAEILITLVIVSVVQQ